MNSLEMDEYLDRQEARMESSWDFAREYCDDCAHRYEDICDRCFGNGAHFEEREE